MTDESYYRRAWKRLLKDAAPWARDNIAWGVIVLVVPPLSVYLANHYSAIDWGLVKSTLRLYLVAFLIYIVVHICHIPRKLDADRAAEEKLLTATIAERDETICELSTKPALTAAEQHDYDVAKKALKQFGKPAVIALRHLRTHGSLTFGTFNPQLPPGMKGDQTMWAYNACLGEGLVTCRENYPKLGDRTFEIAPPMKPVLDDLLYREDSLA